MLKTGSWLEQVMLKRGLTVHVLLLTSCSGAALNIMIPLWEQLNVVQNAHGMSSRSKSHSTLSILYCRLETTKYSFAYRTPAPCSLVDEDLKQRPSYDTFKYNLARSDMFDTIG